MQKKVLYPHQESGHFSLVLFKSSQSVQIMVKTEFSKLSLLLARSPNTLSQDNVMWWKGSVIRKDRVKNSDYNRWPLKHLSFWNFTKTYYHVTLCLGLSQGLKGSQKLNLHWVLGKPISFRKPSLNALDERIFPFLTALIIWYCICGFTPVSSCQLPGGKGPCLPDPNTGEYIY